MAAIAAGLPYITAAVSIGGTIGSATAQQQSAEIQAQQLEKQSVADMAEAVQEARRERKRAELLTSRAVAVAAASGFDVSSVDVQNTISDINEQGEYNALAALYSGARRSESRRYAATVAQGEGRQAATQGTFSSVATILDTASDLYG